MCQYTRTLTTTHKKETEIYCVTQRRDSNSSVRACMRVCVCVLHLAARARREPDIVHYIVGDTINGNTNNQQPDSMSTCVRWRSVQMKIFIFLVSSSSSIHTWYFIIIIFVNCLPNIMVFVHVFSLAPAHCTANAAHNSHRLNQSDLCSAVTTIK